MRIRSALFDLDGVLADSRAAIARSMNHALVQVGLAPEPEARLHPLIGGCFPVGTFTDLERLRINREPVQITRKVEIFLIRQGDVLRADRDLGIQPPTRLNSNTSCNQNPFSDRYQKGMIFSSLFDELWETLHLTRF